jgi:hypothetical protein
MISKGCVVTGYLLLGAGAKLNRRFFVGLLLFRGNNFDKNKKRRCLDCLLLSKFIIGFTKIDGFDYAQPA